MSSSRIYRRLLGYVRPYVWPRFAIAVTCMLFFSASNGLMPFLVRSVFDDIFASKNVVMLYAVPVVILVTFTLRGVANYGNQYFTEWVAQRVITDLRDAMNQRVQYLPLSYFNRTPTGTVVSRVTNDVAQLRNSLVEASVALLRDSASLVMLICVAFYMDWVLAIIGFVVFPVSVLPVLRLSQRLRRYSKRGQATLGSLAALLQETIQGNRIVKAFGMEQYELERFGAENRRLFGLYMKASRAKALIQPLMELLAAFGIAGVVLYGGYSVIEGGRTQGDFFAFLTALVLVYDPFKGLAKVSGAIQHGMGSAERVFELIDEPSDVIERFGARPLAALANEIRFERVSFRYPPRSGLTTAEGAAAASAASQPGDGVRQDAWALREIDLVLRRGEAVALVGGSGGGKSTLADLIPRFYDPTEGRITLDGTDLRDVTIASLRAQIGIVTQFTFLFNDTIRANLAYGSSAPSRAAVEEAARAANAHEFISALPHGYDTVVGELGVMLSGGQRQRIAIARALLKNAPILILDEATSALDSESERLVQDAIERLMEGRTTLVIAHRLATVRRVDRIVVLSDGRIAEEGTHDELIARDRLYRRLHDQQMLVTPAPGGRAADPAMRPA